MKGILAHSYLPLKFLTVAGYAPPAISFVALVAPSLTWILVGLPFAGFGNIVAPTQLAFRLLTEFLVLVYDEVKARPSIVVAEVIDTQDGYAKGAVGYRSRAD